MFKGVWKLFLQLCIVSIIGLSEEICVIVIDVFKEALAVPRARSLCKCVQRLLQSTKA